MGLLATPGGPAHPSERWEASPPGTFLKGLPGFRGRQESQNTRFSLSLYSLDPLSPLGEEWNHGLRVKTHAHLLAQFVLSIVPGSFGPGPGFGLKIHKIIRPGALPHGSDEIGYLKAVWPEFFGSVFGVWAAPGCFKTIQKCGELLGT